MPAPLDCPGIECWQALFDETLPPDQQERYERHLEFCAPCQERLHGSEVGGEALLALIRQVGGPTVEEGDPTLTQFLERLHNSKIAERPALAEPADLYFLHPADRPDLLGVLGAYEIQEVIGQGGMGVVLKAFDPALHRLVAVKVMAAAVAGSAVARKRFVREAQAAAAVCHDHVVTVHGVHEADGLPYLVMQYIAGESLQDRLDRYGPLEVEEVVRIGWQTAMGLAAAHSQGLIHRDIKPANLLLEAPSPLPPNPPPRSGEGGAGSALPPPLLAGEGVGGRGEGERVKITDFGLARMIDDVALTQTGVVAGTPEYMAPEQARGETVDHRADLFSLGSVLYALCTGAPPFRGSTALAVLRQVSEQPPTPIRELNPHVPAWLEAFVARLMAKNPNDRLPSACRAAELLERYFAHLRQPALVPAPEPPIGPASVETLTPSPGPNGRRRQPSPRLVRFLLVALALASAASWLWAILGPDAGREYAQEFSQRFDDESEKKPGLKLIGPEGEKRMRYEPEGLRITLPSGFTGQRPWFGLVTSFGVKGDFEITAGFEILAEKGPLVNPEKNKRSGLILGVIPQPPAEPDPEHWNKPSQNMASLAREVGLRGRTMYRACLARWDEDSGKEEMTPNDFSTATTAGRLRLVRTGPVLFYFAADGPDAPFTLLHKETFGEADLRQVRLVASTGAHAAALDVRVKDLSIRAEAFLKGPALNRKTPAGKTLPIIVSLTALAIATPCAVWLWMRRRSGKTSSPASAPAGEPAPRATALPIGFPCAHCGKPLKVKTELAGKKVKCIHCGKAAQVPPAATSEPRGKGAR